MDSRGVSPVIEKAVTISLVVMFVSGTAGVMFGGVVPTYRKSVADELGDRTLAAAADRIEASIPATAADLAVRSTVSLPPTIADETYRLDLSGRSLRLRHPDPGIDAETHLALPPGMSVRNSTVTAGTVVVAVRGDSTNRTIELEGT